jgi:hypothetical protein
MIEDKNEYNKKSYYAIIPATVRYDKRLRLLSRMLYGEITALCNEKGYCWASNDYFSKLYNVSKETISRCISQLKQYCYITMKIKYKPNTNEILCRHISINEFCIENKYTLLTKMSTPIDENVKHLLTKTSIPIDENVKENITINNTYNNTINNPHGTAVADTGKTDKSVLVNKYHTKLCETFSAGYTALYGGKIDFSGKEISAIKKCAEKAANLYKNDTEINSVLDTKCQLLTQIATRKNKYQNWKFLPSQLLLHWNELVDGCIVDDDKKRTSSYTRDQAAAREKEIKLLIGE